MNADISILCEPLFASNSIHLKAKREAKSWLMPQKSQIVQLLLSSIVVSTGADLSLAQG